jgi:hypothetical protein
MMARDNTKRRHPTTQAGLADSVCRLSLDHEECLPLLSFHSHEVERQ